ncbi:peptidase S8/S53 domain-containing protein [Apodospora peruviana]|uniref:Peptidase S8/S53 domain-containing protein n=1 Tax=Apodospora peruviana TaxID=516989 RepID=A0AAE0M635_9PEZI|nr:peptidase S8/S53 domain-containing protein [Apodospora peruviana]
MSVDVMIEAVLPSDMKNRRYTAFEHLFYGYTTQQFIHLFIDYRSAVQLANKDYPYSLVSEPGAMGNHIIVRLKGSLTDEDSMRHVEEVHRLAVQRPGMRGVGQTWSMGNFKGYQVQIAAEDLECVPTAYMIDYVEEDTVVTFDWQNRSYVTTRHGTTWNLDRISHRESRASSGEYKCYHTGGQGVKIYVLDSGIKMDHEEFKYRARWGANFVEGSPDTDKKGHGSHCAAIAAGKTYGVANRAKIIAVKVMGPEPGREDRSIDVTTRKRLPEKHSHETMVTALISGINWAYGDAGCTRDRSVITMSLSLHYDKAINEAVAAATKGGMTICVSAGNHRTNRVTKSPASARSAITVGAPDFHDRIVWCSNYGPGVDIFAPGVAILSAGIEHDSQIMEKNGTSMAAPHVAGIAACYIERYKISGPAVKDMIIATATRDRIINPKGSPNRIAYNNSGF